MEQYFLGIDVGTQGARAILVDPKGNVIISKEEAFELTEHSRQEQSPIMWWESCLRLLKTILPNSLGNGEIKGISVSSTSGTVIPMDEENNPLHDAIMYSDKRSVKEAELCMETAKSNIKGYTGFNSSSGLSKMIWFANNYPEKASKIRRWAHAADFITGKLSGIWGVTDHTNALKSGYDITNECWPNYLFDHLKLRKEWMPNVYPSGKVIGKMDKALSMALGLKNSPAVTVGVTDGCASQIASGAIRPGDWNSTLGTTLVIKGVTKKQIVDPIGRFYSHKHPEGYWMPGGASNTGADWVAEDFAGQLEELDKKAMELVPTDHFSYPLKQKGERFPFLAPQARGFGPKGISREEHFTANMEGVAYIERYAYELISQLSGEKVQAVYSAGGGSMSQSWLSIRSNVLNLPVYKMEQTSGAFGAAVLAASHTYYSGLMEAGKAMVKLEKKVLPEDKLSSSYESRYKAFVDILKEKGYIKEKDYA